MGFRKPVIDDAYNIIGRVLIEIRSSYNDGFVQMSCKEDVYKLKCWLDDHYNSLPTFAGEEKWEQERIVQILKKE